MRILTHAITIILAAAALLALPFAVFADFSAIGSAFAGVDAVSSASVIQSAPSGRYTVYINREKHPNLEVLDNWTAFFSGDDVPLIMEDIDCVALAEDPQGIEMAKSLQSRLPENQMKLTIEGATMALSKADAGLFDAIVMSEEAARAYDAHTVVDAQDVEVVSR